MLALNELVAFAYKKGDQDLITNDQTKCEDAF